MYDVVVHFACEPYYKARQCTTDQTDAFGVRGIGSAGYLARVGGIHLRSVNPGGRSERSAVHAQAGPRRRERSYGIRARRHANHHKAAP